MRKIICFVLLLIFFSCKEDRILNTCFQGVSLNEVVYLNNPEFNKLKLPNGYVSTRMGGRTILLLRRADRFKAFDLACPTGGTCADPMTFDGLKLICSCNKKEYNSLNGSPIDGEGCFLLEYKVLRNGDKLQVYR